MAIGTLIPTIIECFGLIMPYTLRTLRVSWREAISEIFVPALAPLAPMLIVLYALRELAAPASLVALLAVSLAGLAVYAAGYISIGARPFERELYRIHARSLHVMGVYRKRSRPG